MSAIRAFNIRQGGVIELHMAYATFVDGDYIQDFMCRNKMSLNDLSQFLGVGKNLIKMWIIGQEEVNRTAARLILLYDQIPMMISECCGGGSC